MKLITTYVLFTLTLIACSPWCASFTSNIPTRKEVTPSFSRPIQHIESKNVYQSYSSTWNVATNVATTTTALSISRDEETVQLTADMTDESVTKLFAWVSRAFAGDEEYGNIMLALLATYGNLPPGNEIMKLLDDAMAKAPLEETNVGQPFNRYEREDASLGAMGWAQISGRWRTRPHALLDVRNITHVDEWVSSLPRGVRRTLKKANNQNFTVTVKPIRPNEPAPHSSLAHFRCVVDHEVRIYGGSAQGFFDGIQEAIGRYMGTTRMTGTIREYRNEEGRVIAFAHEVRKGRTIRGQWFYSTSAAAKSYVWFHSVYDLVERAIEYDDVDVVDLGPSGSDAFSELKSRYGFKSVEDWPAVADYLGDFWYSDDMKPTKGELFDEIFSRFKGK